MTLPHPRGEPYRICVVCLGNICRSPMAAAVLAARLDEQGLGDLVQVDSAGTGSWHLGQRADPRARAALDRRGYRDLDHRARQFDPEWFTRLDLVLALDRDNYAALHRLAPDAQTRERVRLLRSFDPGWGKRSDADVPDPYYGLESDFDDSLRIIERSVDGLLALVRRQLVAA